MAKQWYAVHTFTGQENKVKTNLERRAPSAGLEHKLARVLVPQEEETKMRGGKKRTTRKKVFPGYILVEMDLDDSTLYFVRNTVGVTGFVGSNTKPAPLLPEEVENILNTLGESAPRAKPIWHKGEMIRVNSGPFVDHSGRIEDVNAKAEKLTAMISLFGRDIPVEFDFAQVEKL